MKKKDLLVTIALPYANGPLHLGHLLEAVDADIWVRFQKLCGHHCTFISGSDAHGTATMLSAEKKACPPETYVAEIQAEHQKDFANFLIDFDAFGTTHSPENKALCETIYTQLAEKNLISTRTLNQPFDVEKNLFLSDRLIKGTCPKCDATEQYGDHCDQCSTNYSASALKSPYSTLSGSEPIFKESLHYFFELKAYTSFLQNWLSESTVQADSLKKTREWFSVGLKPWNISRDAPYFGFKIPQTTNKYFYVWLDAPIGYMATFKKLCSEKKQLDFDAYWKNTETTELYHFIGKDIVYFHTLFWPALLQACNLRLPTHIFVHGFLTLKGKKMSKSERRFITAKDCLSCLPAEYLRYYLASKLSGNVEDIDLNPEDITQKINANLVGKYVNLASRSAKFIEKYFHSTLSSTLESPEELAIFHAAKQSLSAAFQTRNTAGAIREILALADRANRYVEQHKPWALIKNAEEKARAHQVCTQALHYFRLLTLYLKPILPSTAVAVEHFLNIPPLTWETAEQTLCGHVIRPFTPLLKRIRLEDITPLFNT